MQLLLFALTLALQQPATDTRVRFEQALALQTAEAAAQTVQVSLRDLVIENDQTATVPARGMLVVQMRAGRQIVTTISGTRTEHKDEDFFVVPAGAALTVQTSHDTCVLTILEVQR